MKKPVLRSLDTVHADEATRYMKNAGNDELSAAVAIAIDRNKLDGTLRAPDEMEIHHALFLLRRARGLSAPSYDDMRLELKKRAAAARSAAA